MNRLPILLLVALAACTSPTDDPRRADPAGGHAPWALQVLDVEDGKVTGLCSFLDTEALFPLFGLPPHLDD